MYSRIVVTLDGSEFAEDALVHAVGLAKLMNVPLRLVRVSGAHSVERAVAAGAATDYIAMGQFIEDEVKEAERYIAAIANDLTAQELQVTGTVENGPVIRSILEQVQTGDLLVLASHGRTGIARWFLGSVSEEVVRRSPVPVLLIRNKLGATDVQD
ncbi:MAG: universal stress protein [Thermomicrobiales bacterium]